MEDKNFKPGDIIYADSNFSIAYDCFGVVVDKDFWLEQANKENVLEENLSEFKEKHDVPFRVLGNKLFRQYWRANDSEEVEPDEHKLMHYRFNSSIYTSKIDLRPLIQIRNIRLDKFAGHALKFFDFKNLYFQEALSEAKIVYDYLDGKRLDRESAPYIHKEEKLLRLLEKAIPFDKRTK
jgi:hypothetical protein